MMLKTTITLDYVCVCLLLSVCLCGFVTTLPHLQAHVYRQGQLLDEEGRDRKMI